ATNLPKGCSIKETALTWAERGPQGIQGVQGPKGDPGSDPAADAYIGRFGDNTGNAAVAQGADCTIGEVLLTASTLKTAGGIPADGRLVSIAMNTALFSQLGTTYGGDGKSTFGLPDLRAITPNNMTYSICAWGTYPS